MSDEFQQTAEYLRAIAAGIDEAINGEAHAPDPENGFVLLVFPFDGPEGDRTNYVSNVKREEMLVALKEIVARFEGQAEIEGNA